MAKVHPNSLKNLKPFKKGCRPHGPRRAVASILEELNALAANRNLTAASLRAILRNRRAHPNRQAAALRLLRLIEAPDMASYAPLLDGRMNLEELKAAGIPTEPIKRVKIRTRTVRVGDHDETITERDLELYDRSGVEFDRLLDRLVGKPRQGVELTGAAGGPVKTESVTPIVLDEAAYAKAFHDLYSGTNSTGSPKIGADPAATGD